MTKELDELQELEEVNLMLARDLWRFKGENDVLRSELAEANSLLRSAYSVADREGKETNWNAFKQRLHGVLSRQLEIMKKYGIHPL